MSLERESQILRDEGKLNNVCLECLYILFGVAFDKVMSNNDLYEQLKKMNKTENIKDLFLNHLFLTIYMNKDIFGENVKNFIKVININFEDLTEISRDSGNHLNGVALNLIELCNFCLFHRIDEFVGDN